MRIIYPSHEILNISHNDPVGFIAQCARTCYKSEDQSTPSTDGRLVKVLIRKGHHSQLEHVTMTVKFIIDRGVSHELVRHRLAAYSQESTRYCNYSNGRFDQEITVIKPCFWEEGTSEYEMWALAMEEAEANYMGLLKLGASPQQARSVLPNSLKTEVVMTANLREWRHVLSLRTSKPAHPQIREVMLGLLIEVQNTFPEIFGDIEV
ncbi:MAG: FAD-dependent thymidylate synthase [Desulfovermiculus sp.]